MALQEETPPARSAAVPLKEETPVDGSATVPLTEEAPLAANAAVPLTEDAPLVANAAVPLTRLGADKGSLPTTAVIKNAVLVVCKFVLGDDVRGGAPETEKAGPTVPPGSMVTQEGLEERNTLSDYDCCCYMAAW